MKCAVLAAIFCILSTQAGSQETSKLISTSDIPTRIIISGLGTTDGCWSEVRKMPDGNLYRYQIVCAGGYFSIGIPVHGDFVNVTRSATKVRVLPNEIIELY